MFFDPDTGDVLICDNDNVSANGIDNSSVYGTPRFMAPEIVMGQAKPSRNTDLYSLAVLLFYMFMMGHPLEGKLEAALRQHQPRSFGFVEQFGAHFTQRDTEFFIEQGKDTCVPYDILAESGIKYSGKCICPIIHTNNRLDGAG